RHPDLPVVSADPETFADVMTGLLTSPLRRAELGDEGREFVVRTHDAAVVGEQLEELYAGITPRPRPAVPPGWTAPSTGAQLEEARATIARLKAKNKQLRRRLNPGKQPPQPLFRR